jgi:hypothetical protein
MMEILVRKAKKNPPEGRACLGWDLSSPDHHRCRAAAAEGNIRHQRHACEAETATSAAGIVVKGAPMIISSRIAEEILLVKHLFQRLGL